MHSFPGRGNRKPRSLEGKETIIAGDGSKHLSKGSWIFRKKLASKKSITLALFWYDSSEFPSSIVLFGP